MASVETATWLSARCGSNAVSVSARPGRVIAITSADSSTAPPLLFQQRGHSIVAVRRGLRKQQQGRNAAVSTAQRSGRKGSTAATSAATGTAPQPPTPRGQRTHVANRP